MTQRRRNPAQGSRRFIQTSALLVYHFNPEKLLAPGTMLRRGFKMNVINAAHDEIQKHVSKSRQRQKNGGRIGLTLKRKSGSKVDRGGNAANGHDSGSAEYPLINHQCRPSMKEIGIPHFTAIQRGTLDAG